MSALLLLVATARAEIDPKCETQANDPTVVSDDYFPDGYDEQRQGDFLQNYFALGVTMSPIHAPVPHEAGHGAIALDLLMLPPLGCGHRTVYNQTKTEDTNVTPVAPRPNISFALQGPGPLIVYGAFAYVPPVPVFGTRNVIVAGEFGAGAKVGNFSAGGRIHATSQKTVADIATAFDPATDPAVDDLFVSTSFGFDAMAGFAFGPVTPYVALGVTDVSSIFIVGDDLIVSNNYHPYAGPVLSLGADGLFAERLRVGGEFYAAPGGYSVPKTSLIDDRELDAASRSASGHDYGSIYTLRVRIGVEL